MTDAPRLTEGDRNTLGWIIATQQSGWAKETLDALCAAVEGIVQAALLADRAGREGADDLREKVRALAEPAEEELRDHAYYFGFDLTGVGIIDRILDALCRAGKGFHNTDGWQEPGYVEQPDGTWDSTGPSHEEKIQAAADAAANALRALLDGEG